MIRRFTCLVALCTVSLAADVPLQPSLTIYNQNFAVIRQDLPLDLKAGVNSVRVTDITMHLEPDSVILRDPTGKQQIQVLEQNYRADPVSQELLLSLFEGKTIDFLVPRENKQEVVSGKIIRSGYVPHDLMAMNRYGNQYYQAQMSYAQGGSQQPIIEIDGKLRFGLPGTPLFPALGDDTVLKPTLQWLLSTDKAGPLRAEFSYVSGGLTWQADYNIVAPEKGDAVDVVGWVTMDNQSGRDFQNARIKLMAGDVNKIQPAQMYDRVQMMSSAGVAGGIMTPAVTERSFDEYHLYNLARSTTLHDRETKQVEFIHASEVSTKQIYVYDGLKLDPNRYNGWNWENIRNDFSYGTESNPKIWVMREFNNSEANHLGMPLPKGRVRFYRRNDDGQIEFTGENVIDHTPRDEKVRVYTGNAFDLTGERRRTDYRLETNRQMVDESFEIKVRNHKKQPVDVRVVEHLYRWVTWDISAKSDPYRKMDSKTIEFPVTIPPDGEKTITYTAHYTW
ncbi:MAG TPA: DUF4139 domain-containing protein [Terriglobales bacterium]|nr:DUF4139 domain-containing protein [Terriglobales bacterium]